MPQFPAGGEGRGQSEEKQITAGYKGVWKAISTQRNLGIAAQSRHTVDKLLAQWTAGGKGRWVEVIAQRDVPLTEPAEGQVWWRSHDEDDEEGENKDD